MTSPASWLRALLNLGLLGIALAVLLGHRPATDLVVRAIGDSLVLDLGPGAHLEEPPALLRGDLRHLAEPTRHNGRERWVLRGVLSNEPSAGRLLTQGRELDLGEVRAEPPALEVESLGPGRSLRVRVERPLLVWWQDRPRRRLHLTAGSWDLPAPPTSSGDWVLHWEDRGLPGSSRWVPRELLQGFAREVGTCPSPASELETRSLSGTIRSQLRGRTPLDQLQEWRSELLDSLETEAETRRLWNWFTDWQTLARSTLPGSLESCRGGPPEQPWRVARRERTPVEVSPRAVDAPDIPESQVFHDLLSGPLPLPPPGKLHWKERFYWPPPEDRTREQALFGLRIRGVPPEAWVTLQEMRVNGGGYSLAFPPSDCGAPQEDWFLWTLPTRHMPAAGTLMVVEVRGPRAPKPPPSLLAISLGPPKTP